MLRVVNKVTRYWPTAETDSVCWWSGLYQLASFVTVVYSVGLGFVVIVSVGCFAYYGGQLPRFREHREGFRGSRSCRFLLLRKIPRLRLGPLPRFWWI